MAKKKEKKGFTPELHELFDTLYAKLREYGQCCAFIAICDNKNEITKRIGIIGGNTSRRGWSCIA